MIIKGASEASRNRRKPFWPRCGIEAIKLEESAECLQPDWKGGQTDKRPILVLCSMLSVGVSLLERDPKKSGFLRA